MKQLGHFNDIIFVGHRGTGKTTLGRLTARSLDAELIDIDELIEAREGATCAEIIARDEAEFRRLERATITEVVQQQSPKPRFITPGAGIEYIPAGPLCVWLWRDGWEQTARSERERLRPEMSWSEEVDWMRRTRESRWASAAHMRFDIPRGRLPEFQARMIADHLVWAQTAGQQPVTQQSWVVPSSADDLDRAARDARSLGAAGIEIRSDLVTHDRELEVEPSGPDATDVVDVLASLRTDEPGWLASLCHARHFDIDVLYLDDVLEAGVLDHLAPRPVLLSTHPDSLNGGDLAALKDFGLELRAQYPDWADDVALKFAPPVDTVEELVQALEFVNELRSSPFEYTFLPQGQRFAWLRPWLAREHNATNYLPVGLAPRRCPSIDVDSPPTPMDMQDWLPHLSGPTPSSFEGLLGQPVIQSIGDWWHRSAALAGGEETDYVKIPLGHDATDAQVQATLDVLRAIGFRGLSVTAPLKRRILAFASTVEDLDAVNTLRLEGDGWEATDTDEAGMRATLEAVERAGYAPGTLAVIGRGGVSAAVRRAIDTSDWELVHHASSREGWTDRAPADVSLVVNAAGNWDTVREQPPACDVWVDLNYADVPPAPEGVELHLNGDVFFEAQADAQREFWRGAAAD